MFNIVAIENHTEKASTPRFNNVLSAYLLKFIVKHIGWQAISNVSGFHVQKVGGWGRRPPCSKLGGDLPLPPVPASLLSIFQMKMK